MSRTCLFLISKTIEVGTSTTYERFWQGIGLGDPAFHNLAFDQGIAEAHYRFPEYPDTGQSEDLPGHYVCTSDATALSVIVGIDTPTAPLLSREMLTEPKHGVTALVKKDRVRLAIPEKVDHHLRLQQGLES